MSYLGFSKLLVRDFLTNFNSPKVLEIGLDAGQTTLPMLHNMAVHFDEFTYVGIDVSVNNLLIEQIGQLSGIHLKGVDKNPGNKNVEIYEANSLEWLYSNINQERIYENYDLVMIDGDHNYYTVFNELTMLEDLTHDHTLIVCDDYQGRYSEKDMFYSERDEYKNIELATPRINSEKSGIKNAVNDFVNTSKLDWKVDVFGPGDPCFLYRSEYLKIQANPPPDTLLRDMDIFFEIKKESPPGFRNSFF